MDDFLDGIELKRESTERELKSLVETNNAEALLVCMMPQLLMVSVEQNIGDRLGIRPVMLEILAEVCIPLFGSNATLAVTPIVTNCCYKLLEDLAHLRMFNSSSGTSVSSAIVMQSKIVRGSAYPEQTLSKIASIQGRYDKWFKIQHGVSPNRTVDILTALVSRTEELFSNQFETNRNEGKKFKEFYISLLGKHDKNEEEQALVNMFPEGEQGKDAAFFYGCVADMNLRALTELPADLSLLDLSPKLEKSEILAFKKHFCVNRESIASTEHIQRKTFYELTSGAILFTEISNSSDVIFDKFEELAKLDNQFYSSKYQKCKSDWLESRTYQHLCKIFPETFVYQNLTYPDPTRGKNSSAELDLAVHWGPFLLVVEVKAKQFRFESISGDSGRLRTDIKKNIQDAYDQSLRAIKYIEENEESVFIEKKTKRKLTLKKASIRKVFPVSVTFHYMANLATQLDELKEIGLFTEGRYPFSISESDIELISGIGLNPDTFLHYISRRLSALSDVSKFQGDELDLISAYLDCRLIKSNMMDQGETAPNTISFLGFSEKFDHLMSYKRGECPDAPQIELQLPERFSLIFEQLQNMQDDDARWVSFALLDLENDILYSIGEAIYELKQKGVGHDGFRRMSYHRGDTVVSVVGSSMATLHELKSNIKRRGLIEKYRRETQKSIVFGVLCDVNTTLFDSVVYLDFEWEIDPEVARLVEAEPALVPSVIPGRNKPCFCGSGKKYKKCCRDEVELARKLNPQLS